MDSNTPWLISAIVIPIIALISLIIKSSLAFFLKYIGDSLQLKDEQAERNANRFIEYLTAQQAANLQERLAWVDGLERHTELSKSTYTEIHALVASHEKLLEHIVVIEQRLDTGLKLQTEMLDLQRQAMKGMA